MTTNPLKNIVDKNITDEVHNAFTRYSLGEFVKEPFQVKVGKNDVTVYAGFEYLNFLHRFLAENMKGVKEEVEISGVIESVKNLDAQLNQLGISFQRKKRFGKPGAKFFFPPQAIAVATYRKLVQEFFSEYLLFGISFPGGLLKVKSQTTPKLGEPTEKFVKLKFPLDFWKAFKEDYLFDVTAEGKEIIVNNTYLIDDIEVDTKLLEQDANLARKQARRRGQILRTITVDGKVIKEYKIPFSA